MGSSTRTAKPSTEGLRLSDYARPGRFFLFDEASGDYKRISDESRPEQWAGFGCEMVFGLLRRRRTFACVYTDGSTLWLWVDNKRFDLGGSDVRVKRVVTAPFVRRFEILVGGRAVYEIRYFMSWIDTDAFLGGDFFSFVESRLRTRPEMLRTLYCWNAKAAGRRIDTEEFAAEIDRYVAEVGSKTMPHGIT